MKIMKTLGSFEMLKIRSGLIRKMLRKLRANVIEISD